MSKLEEWVALRVMGWTEHYTPALGDHPMATAWDMNNGRLMAQKDWHPSTDYNQLFGPGGVVEKMREKGFYLKLSNQDDAYWASVHDENGKKIAEDFDLTSLALAVLSAIYQAVEGSASQ